MRRRSPTFSTCLKLCRPLPVVVLAAVLAAAVAARGEPIELPKSVLERPRLKSIYCVEHDLAELKGPAVKAIVFVFLDLDCPVAQSYLPTLQSLHSDFDKQGVKLYGVYPNPRANVLTIAAHALDHDLPFPVFLDTEQKLAKLLQVTVTPEVVLLDGAWERHYQGAIDDQYTKRGKREQPTRHYLRNALTQVLAGLRVDEPLVPPSGCPLERLERFTSSTEYTYSRDIAPVLQKNCQGCHRPGGVAPFSLLTYQDAYENAERIRQAVEERRMPPWHGFLNEKFGKLKNAKNLSEEQVEMVLAWVDQGAPEGNRAEAPPPISWPKHEEWGIGKPDYVYRIPEPYIVPKQGLLEYQMFRVKLDFPEDRWFSAVEVKPGDTSVVHHIGLHLVKADNRVYTGFAGMAALYGVNTQAARLINDYVPGDSYNAKVYPEHQAVRIPKNTDLVFEIHYTPNNRAAVPDQSMVAFKWAKKPPQDEVLTKVFRKPAGRFRIPAGESNCRFEDSYYFEHDVYVDAIRPHFHSRGKSFRVEIVKRDPKTDEVVSRETLITVPAYDPDWQRTYELETPLFVPAGAELVAVGYFDNSKLNPRNPNPNVAVLWGQQSSDEMFSVRFKYHLAQPTP